ncbi:RagB/SusD family nutrient uptake outer membrane protein [Longitalea luteola]|uniref:RagB/SusD family nutrient uptake outer membrane protein n=1 Tax=Longitalea luteola TaxID=2812563 RepID=UPI001A95E553|nr:RagB/SusD family nutrient uptake outer membrane protein [Longitalea luteola]
MLRNQLLALCAILTLALACSKKDKNGDEAPPVNAEVKALQDYLSQSGSLNVFGASLKEVPFTDAEVSNGLTVFAPTNGAITKYDPNARVAANGLTETEIKDHIVKGIIKLVDLTQGKKLTTLSGKQLVVTIDGDKVMINGIEIASNNVDSGKHIIYTISDVLCKKPGAAEITVRDGTLWSATDTLGKTVADADVALYFSRDAYINDQPVFTGKTNAGGKITFNGLTAGTYYLIVKKDDKYNYCEPAFINGSPVAFKPLGIFQNAAQVSSLPHIPNTAPGDFIFQDTNGDGIISGDDRTAIPFEVVVTSNSTVQVTSLIGYTLNHLAAPFTDKANAQQFLDNLYTQIGNWHQLQTLMDGMLSDDAECSTMSSFCSLDNFLIYPTNTYTTSLWQSGYGYISNLNRLILHVPALNLPAAEANNLIAQAKGLRAFVYFELATYYGALPLQTTITDQNLPRTALTETWQFIKNDLTEVMGILPNRFTGADHFRINGNACKLLLARIAMAQGDFGRAKQLTDELIAAATYSLVPANEIFVNADNAEIIWNMKTGIASVYNTFFTEDGVRNFNPVARYAEVLLINAEARVYLGQPDATNINLLRTRRGGSAVTFANNSEAMDTVRLTWKNEMYREGQRFAKLVKWSAAMDVLFTNGFREHHSRLPLPQYIMDKNFNLYQNAGY